ncbi:hypothetical protein [Aestuariivirga sp.]|uniref:hypothetical protein n=1 Tax=Aestuariivirga sp. TaxID=2650926 RepID=UPI003BAB88D3
MAITPGSTTPGSRQRSSRPEFAGDDERVPLTAASSSPLTNMQEPLGSMDRPVPRNDENDLNLNQDGVTRRAGNLGRTETVGAERGGRSFTTTFAIAAVVLVAAFLIALWLSSNRTDVATAPAGTEAPIADTTAPGTANDTTGSTTAPIQQTAPGTGDAGTGTTAPASP